MAQNKDIMYPVVRKGRLWKDQPSISAAIEVNFERLLSKSNRRLYRQSRVYNGKIDIDPSSTQTYHVYVLSNTWMNNRALKMAYAMYLENSEDERDRLKGSQLARWEDFRVRSGPTLQDIDPLNYQFSTSGLPIDDTLGLGEFNETIVVDAAGVTKSFSWGPATASRYSILEEYDKAGNAQTSPTASTGDMPYDDLMADDDAVMGSALQSLGNSPPYDADGVHAANPWIKVAVLQAGTTQKLSTGFFEAPCGFVIITAGTAVEDEFVDAEKLSWTVKAGDYKGVHAPSMLE